MAGEVIYKSEFTTKRFLFDLITNGVPKKNGCYAVIGARRVGKTQLFLQLNEYFGNKASYLSLEGIKVFSFADYYSSMVSSGKEYVFIDEVCKLDEDYIGDFIVYSRLYSSRLKIFITGSVSASVRMLCYDIGRGGVYEMPPIMYCERLAWKEGFDSIYDTDLRGLSSDDKYKMYLMNQYLEPNELKEYFNAVVNDTILSYTNSTALDGVELVDAGNMYKALQVISICQRMEVKRNGLYASPKSLESEIAKKLKEEYGYEKRFVWNKKAIESTLTILLNAGLAKIVSKYNGGLNDSVSVLEAFGKLPAVIFEYPWYASVWSDGLVEKSKMLLAVWVEHSLLLRTNYIYPFVDKFRDISSREIDIVYLTDNGFYYGLEVKSGRESNVSHEYKMKIDHLANEIGLKDCIISSSDGQYRNDLLALCLEFEYIDIIRRGDIYSSKNTAELYSDFIK